jgi:hypothetical protein
MSRHIRYRGNVIVIEYQWSSYIMSNNTCQPLLEECAGTSSENNSHTTPVPDQQCCPICARAVASTKNSGIVMTDDVRKAQMRFMDMLVGLMRHNMAMKLASIEERKQLQAKKALSVLRNVEKIGANERRATRSSGGRRRKESSQNVRIAKPHVSSVETDQSSSSL